MTFKALTLITATIVISFASSSFAQATSDLKYVASNSSKSRKNATARKPYDIDRTIGGVDFKLNWRSYVFIYGNGVVLKSGIISIEDFECVIEQAKYLTANEEAVSLCDGNVEARLTTEVVPGGNTSTLITRLIFTIEDQDIVAAFWKKVQRTSMSKGFSADGD